MIGKRAGSSDQDAALVGAGRKIEQLEIRPDTELGDIARREGITHEVAILTSILNQAQTADGLLAGSWPPTADHRNSSSGRR